MITTLQAITDTIVTGVVLSRFAAKDNSAVQKEEHVLTLRSINYGVIDRSKIESIKLAKEIEADKLTQRGDIILKMNKPYDAVYMERGDEELVIPSFCCKIAGLHSELADPYYVTGFLNSAFVKEFLATANGASSASLLKIKDIKKLPVYLPSLSEQKAIGEIFQAACERQLLLKEIMRQELRMTENIFMNAAREVWERETEDNPDYPHV